MKTKAISSITIKAPPSDIFVYFKELGRHQLWSPILITTKPRQLSLKQGSRYITHANILGVRAETNNVVSKFSLDREIEIKIKGKVLTSTTNFQLTPKNNHQTMVTMRVDLAVAGPAFSIADSVLKKLAIKEIKSDLESLKIAVENKINR